MAEMKTEMKTEAEIKLKQLNEDLKDDSHRVKLKQFLPETKQDLNVEVWKKYIFDQTQKLLDLGKLNTKSLRDFISEDDFKTINGVVTEFFRKLGKTRKCLSNSVHRTNKMINKIEELQRMFQRSINKLIKTGHGLNNLKPTKILDDDDIDEVRASIKKLKQWGDRKPIEQLQQEWVALREKFENVQIILQSYEAKARKNKRYIIGKIIGFSVLAVAIAGGIAACILLIIKSCGAFGLGLAAAAQTPGFQRSISVGVTYALSVGVNAAHRAVNKANKLIDDIKETDDITKKMKGTCEQYGDKPGNKWWHLFNVADNAIEDGQSIELVRSIVTDLHDYSASLKKYIDEALEIDKACKESLIEYQKYIGN